MNFKKTFDNFNIVNIIIVITIVSQILLSFVSFVKPETDPQAPLTRGFSSVFGGILFSYLFYIVGQKFINKQVIGALVLYFANLFINSQKIVQLAQLASIYIVYLQYPDVFKKLIK